MDSDTEATLDAAGTEGMAVAAGHPPAAAAAPRTGDAADDAVIDLTKEDDAAGPSRIPETPPTAGSSGYEPAYACGICFRSMLNKPMAAVSGCGHVFCAGCLETALDTPHPRCPKCMRQATLLPLYF